MNKPRVLQTARKEEELPCERSLKTLKSKAADHVAKTAKQLKEANKTMMAPLERRKLRLQELEITQDTAARVRHQRSWAQHPNRTVEAGRREFEFAAAGQGEARRAETKLSWGNPIRTMERSHTLTWRRWRRGGLSTMHFGSIMSNFHQCS